MAVYPADHRENRPAFVREDCEVLEKRIAKLRVGLAPWVTQARGLAQQVPYPLTTWPVLALINSR